MKLFLLISFLLLGFFIILNRPALFPYIYTGTPQTGFLNSPAPSPHANNPVLIDYNGKKYSMYRQIITAPGMLRLIPNFEEQKTARQIMQENKCLYGANGGFYTPDHRPVGLFLADGQNFGALSPNNALLNGIIYQNRGGLLEIRNLSEPIEINAIDFMLQTGPRIVAKGRLTIRNDEPARRVLLAHIDSGSWYFIALTDADNTNSGPLLGDLPMILSQELAGFDEAINLDGGSASAFFADDGTVLGEITPIGSFLCGQ